MQQFVFQHLSVKFLPWQKLVFQIKNSNILWSCDIRRMVPNITLTMIIQCVRLDISSHQLLFINFICVNFSYIFSNLLCDVCKCIQNVDRIAYAMQLSWNCLKTRQAQWLLLRTSFQQIVLSFDYRIAPETLQILRLNTQNTLVLLLYKREIHVSKNFQEIQTRDSREILMNEARECLNMAATVRQLQFNNTS